MFYLGCAVWAYKGWVGDLFPPGSKSGELLHLYSRRLSTVEGNTTFYAVPTEAQVARWAADMAPGFRFCPKLHRDISHAGPLMSPAARAALDVFVARMRGFDDRLGPMFLQLPGGYAPSQIGDLAAFLDDWPRDLQLAVEVRHKRWYAPPAEAQLMALLERYGVGRVLMDVRPLELGPLPGAEEDLEKARDNKPDVPLHPLRSGPVSLVRYIGHPDVALNAPLLDEWATRLAEWLAAGIDVYAFMHCPVEERAPTLCRMLHERLARLVPITPLPAWGDEAGPVQAALF
jgi:uncharacterized protein YecE (DUF72 family)